MTDELVPGLDGMFCLYLKGFNKTSEEITDIFSAFGNVMSTRKVNYNYFVRYAHKEEAVKAIDAFANKTNLKVTAAHQKDKNTSSYEKQVQEKMSRNRYGHSEGNIQKHGNYNHENNKGARNFQDQSHNKESRNEQSYNKHRYIQHKLDDSDGAHFEDKSTGKRNDYIEGNKQKHKNYNQENHKGVRNFQDQSESRDKYRNMQHEFDYNVGQGENRRIRRSDGIDTNDYNKQGSATSSKGSENKYRFSNGYISNTNRAEKVGRNYIQSDKYGQKSQEYSTRYETDKSQINKEEPDKLCSDHKGQTSIDGSNTDHDSSRDNASQTRVAKEVIIADLPHGIMQADIYKLIGYANPLHIDIHKINDDDITYAHVYVRTNEDVDMLVKKLNEKMWLTKKLVVMPVENVTT